MGDRTRGGYHLCPDCGWSGPAEDLAGEPPVKCPVCGATFRG